MIRAIVDVKLNCLIGMIIRETEKNYNIWQISRFTILVVAMFLLSFQVGYSQTSHSPNTFSPYTMYGLGDCVSPTTASQRGMGGVCVAMRPNMYVGPSGVHMEVNYMNPASVAFMPPKTALFSFGGVCRGYLGQGWGYDYSGNYVSTRGARNSASMNDIGLSVPISRTLALGLSLVPTTIVGYRITSIGNEEDISQSIGRTLYTYTGEGGVSEFKASLGGRITKNFSIGASIGYYFGNIDKSCQATMVNMISSETSYRYVANTSNLHISEWFLDAGFIYTFRLSKDGYLNVGGTFRSASFIDAPTNKATYVTDGTAMDTISTYSGNDEIKIPLKIAGGLFYNNSKISVGLDYEFQDYSGAFDTSYETTGYSLSTQSQIRLGFAYTPNQFDLYETYKRLTYKAGFKYGKSYLVKDGYQMKSGSFTLGLDIPLKRGTLNKVSIALEVGMRGKHIEGQIKESFYKLNVGFAFFGDDMWFHRRKFY